MAQALTVTLADFNSQNRADEVASSLEQTLNLKIDQACRENVGKCLLEAACFLLMHDAARRKEPTKVFKALRSAAVLKSPAKPPA